MYEYIMIFFYICMYIMCIIPLKRACYGLLGLLLENPRGRLLALVGHLHRLRGGGAIKDYRG